ncbi:MAG TPA: carboxymuconolactone decarboxylase family protein [Stellaceae bacterium]|nr:carboxymuconolactone decarboxylase family protein [Stellaceae bacterium]
MARAPALEPDRLTTEQKRVHDEIAKRIPHGVVRGPFAVLLNAPALADGAIRTYTALREARLERRLVELMILVVARFHSAQYEWFAHGPRALEAGIAAETVEAIRQRRAPALVREDEKLVYDVVTELLVTRRLSAASYERAQALLGTERLVELIGGAGFYTMVALTINAFDVDVPEGARPLPD